MTTTIFRRNAGGIAPLSILLLAVCALISACNDDFHIWTDDASGNKISIGGIDTDALTVSGISSRGTATASRATAVEAERVDWLRTPLKDGIDITYGLYNATPNHEDVAILKLSDTDGADGKDYDTDPNSGLAVYTFRYRRDRSAEEAIDSENNAIWYNNGYHYFQGVHVPERIRYVTNIDEIEKGAGDKAATAFGLVTDQHNDTATGTDDQLGNYTLLSHYLGMPAGFRLTATVERIKLPFRHRLARVIAFILIDPELETTLKGYKKDAEGNTTAEEDPTTTSFRFCNVKVLQGVKDEEGTDGHHTLTPTWGTARKVIPHFEGEKGSYNYKTGASLDDAGFKYYYKVDDNGRMHELFPTSKGWEDVHNDTGKHNGYTEVDYGKVPVYDIIVRPTYTTADSVMYDEKDYATRKTELAAEKNKIDFEIELENGLRYEKRFEFDLNANYQTVVYLRIAREHVDYNDAGSELWQETKNWDGWYGVDNENGNTLSLVGSSWQRAYTYGAEVTDGVEDYTNPHSTEGVTDGKFYNASSSPAENKHAQYFTDTYKDMWVERFLQACQGGKHHGDYFVLRNNISIDARQIPKDFVFTGHLDGQDSIITLTNCGERVYKIAETLEGLYTKSGEVYTSWSIPTLYVKHVTPAVYYHADELKEVNGKTYVTSTLTYHPAVAEVSHEATADDVAAGKAEKVGEKVVDVEFQAAYYEVTGSSIEATADVTVKTPEETSYPIATASTSPAYPTTLDDLRTSEYYRDQSGHRFECPTALYQFSHESPAYLFAGLNGTYTTAQESNPSIPVWEANVHKETNNFGDKTHWVPTTGYRAEVINVRVAAPATVFKADATPYTGNVQNCWSKWTGNKATSVSVPNNTPAIPQYK